MRVLRNAILAAMVLFPLSVALMAPASAATRAPAAATSATAVSASPAIPQVPFPSCGTHFQLTRNGRYVRVVGTGLNAFSSGYMLVYVAANGNLYGPYNASPKGGANFESDTGSVRQTTIAITLTTPNGDPLCAQDYYA